MKILNNNNIAFRGPLDGAVTNILRTCDMNEMVNAVGLDVGAMVVPRAYYDTKARNEYAGAETFFREISGTFINCLSAGILAKFIAKIAAKDSKVQINPNSWYSNNSLETLKEAWHGNDEGYVKNVFENLSGRDGRNINEFKKINWNKIEWIDEAKWNRINWKNKDYKNIAETLKTKGGFVKTLTKLIRDKNLDKNDKINALSIMEKRLVNALGAERDTKLNINGKELSAKLENILRDTLDMGRDVLGKKDTELIINRIKKVNKMKAFGAIAGSCALGLTNQYINRKITEKRTGRKGFVGDIDFTSELRKDIKKDDTLWFKKIGASLLMAGMVFSVMRVKNFKQFAQKLEFTGPVTGGNAIKTVYASTIIGRFLAADNGTELRESMTRDYLGFLNWLVFGGFAAKGVANILDKKGEFLFNYAKENARAPKLPKPGVQKHSLGLGRLRFWLNDMTLKTHNEIASKGSEFAKKNMWKLNLAHISGIAYSAITLGILLPMLNAVVTKRKQTKRETV